MYDEGYSICPCFWGTKPAWLVEAARSYFPGFDNVRVLDIGCGDGKNAYFLASLGAQVRAVDISPLAIEHAKCAWPSLQNLTWEVGDIRHLHFLIDFFDIIVATGILHCLKDKVEMKAVIHRMKSATKQGGFNIISAFNTRFQDLSGHGPHFHPCLLPHSFYVEAYNDWEVIHKSDKDLDDIHPHNQILHHHSITRILARNTW